MIAKAVGEPAYWAVNHNQAALDMYRQNHPFTKLYCEDIFAFDPIAASEGRDVWLLWASPDCTHHSKARGGKPREKKIRGLPWIIVREALKIRPGSIMFENVEEIQSWGPLMAKRDAVTGRMLKIVGYGHEKGSQHGNPKFAVSEPGEVVPPDKQVLIPDPKRAGETFNGFISMMTTGIEPGHPALIECCEALNLDEADTARLINGLGYTFEGRELVAADYGAPTIRKRFYGIFRCDGRPIMWPEPTHSKYGANGKKKWRSAAEIIDWSLPCPSIFDDKAEIKRKYGLTAVRPLADNTLKRAIRGVDKFTIKSGKLYSAKLDMSVKVMDRTKACTNLKSGYGFSLEVTCTVTTDYPVTDKVEAPKKVLCYVPDWGDYNYAVSLERTDNGGAYARTTTWQLPVNTASGTQANKWYVPTWWSDKTDYNFLVAAKGVYTPGGELTAAAVQTIKIDSNMYTDDYSLN